MGPLARPARSHDVIMPHRILSRFAPLAALLLVLVACDREPSVAAAPSVADTPDESAAHTDAPASDDTPSADSPPSEADAEPDWSTQRIVALGDVHGDIDSAREALRLAGAIDAADQWIGGDLVVVQVGDQLDRGDTERQILDLFESLRAQARAAGGAFYPMLGNHEVMNVQLDLRYVTDGGFEEFADIDYDPADPSLAAYHPTHRGRVAAFRPGGAYANILAEHLMVLQLGENLFVHGGLVPTFAEQGIDAINDSVAAWMRGDAAEPAAVQGNDCPIWSRHFSNETGPDECALLQQTLDMLGAKRMIVAHTVQQVGINSACDGAVWRVDVGLSDYYGGETQVLEIVGDTVTPIR